MDNSNKSYTVYCHFSFRRPKNVNYGIFAVAFYSDFEGKKLLTYIVRKYDLWENHQFITAIQSYEHALHAIYEMQGQMKSAKVGQVMLVTDNSTLAGWIINHKKNKSYTKYMEQAVAQYRAGGPREITLGIGLCNPRDSEKSYKYCKEELVSNEYVENRQQATPIAGGYKINLGEYKSIVDIIKEDKSIPEIEGISSL